MQLPKRSYLLSCQIPPGSATPATDNLHAGSLRYESRPANFRMLTPTSVKDALQSAAPADEILVQGWVRTRRDAKAFSFIELNDGSSPAESQVIATTTLPTMPRCSAQHRRLDRGPRRIGRSQGKGQKWEVVGGRVHSRRRGGCHLSAAEEGPHDGVSARDRAPAAALELVRRRLSRAQPAGLRHPPIFPGARLSSTSTRRSSPPATAKARARCSASPRSIEAIRRRPRTARSTTRKDFFGAPTYLTVSGQLEARSSPARSPRSTPSARRSAPRTPTPRGTPPSSGWSSRRWRSAIWTATWTSPRSS